LKNSLLENYKKELTDLIEKKKYYDSVLCSSDTGPTIAIANMIEDGEYAEFVKKFNHGDIQLTGLEHVLKVRESFKGEKRIHYLMPKSDEMRFQMSEQMGVVQFALYQKVLAERKRICNPNLERLDFILKNDREFPKMFRDEILEKTRVNKLEGYYREYANCVIYENLFDKILEKFCINLEDVETADSLSRLAYYSHQIA